MKNNVHGGQAIEAGHNLENPVSCSQACKELGVSQYFLKAVRGAIGIRARRFMLSRVRDYLRDHPEFSTSGRYKSKARTHRLDWRHDGKSYVVSVPGNPDVMAEDRSLSKALAQAGKQLEGAS